MITRFIDVGIAVRDLDHAVATYCHILGTTPAMLGPEHYVYPGLKGARFYLPNATISLIASDDHESPVAKFIADRGEGVNHISLEVTDLDQDMKDMAEKGFSFLTQGPLPFPQGHVVFAHPRSTHGVQIAFVQAAAGVNLLSPPQNNRG
jgi:methylmalonyl-CoA/ethylmalonyl-CoA epimerase